MKLAALLGLILVLMSLGCDELFYVALSEARSTPDKPVFVLGKDDSLFDGKAKVYGWNISGRPADWMPGPDTANPWSEFWSVRVGPEIRYVELDYIVYPELPLNMYQITDRGAKSEPDTLPSGYVYVLHVGYHGVGSLAYFEIRQDSSGTRSIHALTEEELPGIVRP